VVGTERTRDARWVDAVLSRALEFAAEDEPESSADATHDGVATAPPMPSAIANAPTRPMYLDASAENMRRLLSHFWLQT
jgi:hypothetical protein